MAELERQSEVNDPIASLHRMSTTAGVATSDYVAINSLALVALLLGAATLLAFAWLPLLLIGLAGIACGVMAIRDIRNSNGTQAGTPLAVLGMVLSVLLGATALAMEWASEAVIRPDRQAINRTIGQLGQHLSQRDYAAAYALFDPEFQQGSDTIRPVTAEEFAEFWKSSQEEDSEVGPLIAARGNDVFRFSTLADGTTLARTNAIFSFEKHAVEPRISFELRKQPDGSWKILAIPQLIDQRPPRPRQ
jgi:hypothetical protein